MLCIAYHVSEFGKHESQRHIFLGVLSTDECSDVRSAVAYNVNTPVEVLLTLSTGAHWAVRSAVAYNVNTPVEVLGVLSTDAHWAVRYAVVNNKNFENK